MPRTARLKSGTGVYHLILRGINRRTIFKDDEDATVFLHALRRYKAQSKYKIYAYCLMSNHVHLLIKEEIEPLAIIMRRFGASYVYWYNQKYERSGHLFQDRFKSEVVEDDSYFLTVVRYIHQNPMKAKLVCKAEDYKWSSYREFIGQQSIIDRQEVLAILGCATPSGMATFKNLHDVIGDEQCLEIVDRERWTDNNARLRIKNVCEVKDCRDIQNLMEDRLENSLQVLVQEGISVRQLSRLTGMSRWFIQKFI